MIKPLKSRLTAICLVAVVLLIWLGDILSPRGTARASKANQTSPAPTPTKAAPPSSSEELSILPTLKTWIEQAASETNLLREDPFTYPADPAPMASPLTNATPASPPPRLHGISIGAGKPLAVLNRSVVGEGDTIGPWRVEEIAADSVRLAGPQGLLSIHVERPPVPIAKKAPQTRPTTRGSTNKPAATRPSATKKK